MPPRVLERPGKASGGDFASGLLSVSVKRNGHPALLPPLWAMSSCWRVSSGLLPLDHFRGAVRGHSQAAEPNAQSSFLWAPSGKLATESRSGVLWINPDSDCAGPPEVDAEAPLVPVPRAAVKGSSAFSSRGPGCQCIPLTTS